MYRPCPIQPEQRQCQSLCTCAMGPAGGVLRRLRRWRETWLLRRALLRAGEPSLLLDLSTEAGGFWSLLGAHANRVILAAGASQMCLETVRAAQSAALAERIRVLPSMDAALQLPSNAVDCILAMGLLSDGVLAEQRLALLGELRRVTRDTLILSLAAGRFPVGGALEAEFARAGFQVVGRYARLPGCSRPWIYVLRKEG